MSQPARSDGQPATHHSPRTAHTAGATDPVAHRPVGHAAVTDAASPTVVARDLLTVQTHMDYWLGPWVRRERMGLSPSLVSVLYLIRDEATPTLRSLADRLSVTPTAITSITDRLEGLGYVRRVRTSHDRRRTQLEITPAGRAISLEIEDSFVGEIHDVIAGWDETRLVEVHEAVRTLTTFLGELSGVSEPAP